MIIDLSVGAPAGADDATTTMGPSPQDPPPGMSDESTEITAGLGGFLVLFALALAVWFLGRDLTRRLRRMSRAEQQRVDALRAPASEDATGAKGAKDTKRTNDTRGTHGTKGTHGSQGADPDEGA